MQNFIVVMIVSTQMPLLDGEFPTPTFLVNIIGSFLLGALVAGSMAQTPMPRPLLLLLGTGLCGGFTTYSAFAVENVALLENGYHLVAILYIVTTLIGCMLAAALGLTIVRSIIH